MIKTSWWLVILAFLVVGTSTSYAHGISEADKQAMLDGGYLNYLQLGATHMVTGYDHLLFSRSDAPRRDPDVGKSATISPSRFHFIALAPAASKTCPRCSANDLPTEDLDDSSKVVAGVAETQRNLLGGNISSKLGPVTPFHWLSLITNTEPSGIETIPSRFSFPRSAGPRSSASCGAISPSLVGIVNVKILVSVK